MGRVIAFASPPVICANLMRERVGRECVWSVALSTDFITRLSIESVLEHNARTDVLLGMSDERIEQCVSGEMEEEEMVKVLEQVKNVKGGHLENKLYPVGRVLWFVPKAAIEEDEEKRVRGLMRMESADEEEKEEKETEDAEDEEKESVKKGCALMAALSVGAK